ncbi:MAG: carbamoyltransferase HypF [Oscillospiraceae bacterium]|nr:carbamoyltransferase HypF [Oscillospiraceae bacterium]
MQTRNIHVYGIVQGVGFRPFTVLTAEQFHIKGSVANKGSYVEIIAQGEPDNIRGFINTIKSHPPERAMVLSVDSEDWEDRAYTSFEIIESEKEYGDIFVSPDIAVCEQCRTELFDPNNRRYLHPFINCTQCGPRLTILDAMPYDRERTSMSDFPMCEPCASEYHDPATRRYDAQPVCCNDCGPQVFILGSDLRNGDAISAARRAIMDGKIVAIKGIGGFHLCCDAKNRAAVEILRERKHRPMKPFAVMMRNLETAERECILQDGQREMLDGWQKPILLLRKRPQMSICDNIAPDNLTVGVMLPYTPLHMLLFDYPDGIEMTDCLVMTSGNARGAPICRDDPSALTEIGRFCDLILTHDRRILIRADDSVCDWMNGKPYMIRRSRGFAPLPFMLHHANNIQALAIGGELKNTFCIARNGMLYLSPYVGDMADIRTQDALRETVGRMCALLETAPDVVVCDTHPMYNTVDIAKEFASERSIPLIQIQHHFAHILSCMAEHNYTDSKVIGVSMDGTGYGDDATIWGGELLICDVHGYERAGHIMQFMQTGGDLSAKEGWRIAIALLRDALGDEAGFALAEQLHLCDESAWKTQSNMARLSVNSVTSTSCGRIFDAVSAMLGIRTASTFEGEASTALMYHAEIAAEKYNDIADDLPSEVSDETGKIILNTTQLTAAIAERFAAEPTEENRLRLAYGFHKALAQLIYKACRMIRTKTGINVCALSGGVFQNRLLTVLVTDLLEHDGFTVLRHSLIPPNDGGIAAGQALFAAYNFNSKNGEDSPNS